MANIYRPFPGDITRVHGIRVGQAQNAQAMTRRYRGAAPG